MTKEKNEPESLLLAAAQEANAAGRGRIILFLIVSMIGLGVWGCFWTIATVNDGNQKKEALQSRWIRTRTVSIAAEAFKAKHGIYPSRIDAEFLNAINEANAYKDALYAPPNASEWVEIQNVKSASDVEPRAQTCAPGHVVYCFIEKNGTVDDYFVVGKDALGRVGNLHEFRTLVEDVRTNSKSRTATSP